MSLLRVVLYASILLSMASFSPVRAQSEQSSSDPAEGTAQPGRKQYLVEVVTFHYLGPDTSGGEQFDQLFVEDYLPKKPFDIDEYNRTNDAVHYVDLVNLADALEKLRVDKRYEVMSSSAWVQPLLDRKEAVNVPLGYGSGTGTASIHTETAEPVASRVSGSLSVYGDYLLFVDLDLKIALPTRPGNEQAGMYPASDSSTMESGGAVTTAIYDQGTTSPEHKPFETFEISEKRRIKLEEVHYFDHPYFGAIVMVSRYEDKEEQ